MKVNKTYTQNEKTSQAKMFLKKKQNERWKIYQAWKGKCEVCHFKICTNVFGGVEGEEITIQQNQNMKQ